MFVCVGSSSLLACPLPRAGQGGTSSCLHSCVAFGSCRKKGEQIGTRQQETAGPLSYGNKLGEVVGGVSPTCAPEVVHVPGSRFWVP